MAIDSSLFEFMSLNEDGTTINANVNGVVTPQRFYYTCPENKVVQLHRLIVFIDDVGTFTPSTYGNIATLANGIEVTIEDADGNTLVDISNGSPIHSISDWLKFCFDGRLDDFGSGANFYIIRWTFASSGRPLELGEGDKFIITINDDLTGLTEHSFNLQGVVEG